MVKSKESSTQKRMRLKEGRQLQRQIEKTAIAKRKLLEQKQKSRKKKSDLLKGKWLRKPQVSVPTYSAVGVAKKLAQNTEPLVREYPEVDTSIDERPRSLFFKKELKKEKAKWLI